MAGRGLPEDCDYEDTGCPEVPECVSSLHCPRERCIYDELGERRAWRRARNLEIAAHHRLGLDARTLGDMHGLSRRQVFRILRDGRRGEGSVA